ncbi:hypothetical protein CEUSTIGMA_g9601.t1 [Chlamydomonas eustigma]|uniref:Uncharacterized protein n=1 Tax=Chlamydomonas eustigma TaxID=1157962 RepID=A0A250XGJ2_9CHLO|nr:hypothetical protein CEUSTIGMA_g9601.t1 [Chlamydomonas eustigma]|eukprot:GAX82173.1 hypothetical protein CEUSTIGMA_g9601.t1 [Chlamydomonas eustigma]
MQKAVASAMLPEAFERAQERLILHELIRLGVARQEDLQLLQKVGGSCLEGHALSAAHAAHLIRECSLREEWRCEREAYLLNSVGSSSWLSCGETMDQMKLVDQFTALQQIEEEQRALLQKLNDQKLTSNSSSRRQTPSHSTRLPPQKPPKTGSSFHPRSANTLSPKVMSQPKSQVKSTVHMSGSLPLIAPSVFYSSLDKNSSPLTPTPYHTAVSPARRPLPTTQHQLVPLQGRRTPPLASSVRPPPRTTEGLHTSLLPPRTANNIKEVEAPHSMQSGVRPTTSLLPQRTANNIKEVEAPHSMQSGVRPTTAPNPQLPSKTLNMYSNVKGHMGLSNVKGHMGLSNSSKLNIMPPRPPSVSSKSSHSAHAGNMVNSVEDKGARFQVLYKLHTTLLQNLEGHKAASGADVATQALKTNIQEAQHIFLQCVAEVALQVDDLRREEGVVAGRKVVLNRCIHWDRMIQLGQLGLTTADVAKLQHLRRSQAARVIQRALRPFLDARRHQRAVEEARLRAREIQMKRRRRAAVVIQKIWRGRAGRMHAARLKQEAVLQQRQARTAALRQQLAAIRIQRCYRAFQKRRRAKMVAAMTSRLNETLSATSVSSANMSESATDKKATMSGQVLRDAHSSNAAEGLSMTGQQLEPSIDSMNARTPFFMILDIRETVRSTTVIQAHVRGWLVRRSTDLWWTKSKADLRERRSGANAWLQHRDRMAQSFELQDQLVDSILLEAQLCQGAIADATRERMEFESSWDAWLGSQLSAAMQQQLPRGWVPHPDPVSGNLGFLNTKTGELHAFHPAVQQLRGHVTHQRDVAEARQIERELNVAAYLDSVHRAGIQEQVRLLRKML